MTQSLQTSAPWHKASFDRFVNDRLPALLAARLPLAGYHVEPATPYACRVAIALSSEAGEVQVDYADVPQPDAEGVFEVDGVCRVVVPIASREELDVAEIRCVGEQLYDWIEARLGEAPSGLPWDASLVRAWLPLDSWVREFLTAAQELDPRTRALLSRSEHLERWQRRFSHAGQVLDEPNWLSRQGHLRSVLIPTRERLFAPGQIGRACPFETPEGPNIGRVLHIAVGAEIEDGKLQVIDEAPESALGLTASMVPFLEHNDANRQLMGTNMMRQWLVPPDPEPAWVQTGNGPDVPDFWCGRNLLTAFISWDDTFEDGIVISASCAARLSYPHALEPGDKLSNRHGTKGTVARIVPDDEMPHLPDGTPVEIVFGFIGCHTRMNFGQIREAVMGRIARAEGTPVVVRPFHAPSEQELRERLAAAGLPESGMEVLAVGKGGGRLDRPSTVGWVYWGKTFHVARDKLYVSIAPPSGQEHGDLEYLALRDVGAVETIGEHFNTRAASRPDAASLADRVAAGPVEQAGPPTPAFAELARRLAVTGIATELTDTRLAFRFASPPGATLKLAGPVPHPWLADRELTEVGAFESLDAYHALVQANAKAQRAIDTHSPDGLKHKAFEQLEACVRTFFDALVTPEHVRFTIDNTRVLFCGWTAISPGWDLGIDQLGVPDEIAWTIFGPLVVRELGADQEVKARSERAAEVLDRIMSESWVILYRAPATRPTAFVAFHPVRIPGHVIRLQPLVCPLMNADFDGDQAAVFLPITEAGQREADERLSVAGHLRRDPGLIQELSMHQEAMWGLACLSTTEAGRREIADLAGVEVAAPEGLITRRSLGDAMRRIVERDGVDAALEVFQRLMQRGFEAGRQSGASLSPFFGQTVQRPTVPTSDDAGAWNAYAEELVERLASRTDYADSDIGPQLLAVKSEARGSMRHLVNLIGPGAAITDVDGTPFRIQRGFRDGLTPREMFAWTVRAREALGQVVLDLSQIDRGLREGGAPTGFNLMSRAMRAERPGIVFARAAASGEGDPLADPDTRAFVGLPIQPS